MSTKKLLGGIAIAVGFGLIIPTFSATNIIPFTISVILLLVSILSGRKIAYLIHDSNVLKRKAKGKFSPAAMVSFWVLIFILMVIAYTIAFQIFFKSISFMIASFTGSYLGLLSSIIVISGAYALYRDIGDEKGDVLLSSWGKRISKMQKTAKSMVDMPAIMKKQRFF